jgi:hypothetical protein
MKSLLQKATSTDLNDSIRTEFRPGSACEQPIAYSVSATKTAVVGAGTVAVPALELNVDCPVVGSLEFRCTGCRCKAKPCRRLSVKVTAALVALKITTMCLYIP